MFDLKFKVMLIRIGAKTNFFYDRFGGIGFDFLFLLTLVVEEFVEFYDPADRRICVRGDHHEVLTHVFSPVTDLSGWIDTGFNQFACYFAYVIKIVTDETDVLNADIAIDLEFVVVVFSWWVITGKSFCQGLVL